MLIEKLKFYGVTGTASKLVKSYLSNRFQRVKVRNNHYSTFYSKWDEVKLGVPQVSVLGPLLFLVYINDLPGSVNDISSPILYADDTNLICTHQNIFSEKIETVFCKVNRWLLTNLLTSNFKKTNFMQVSNRHLGTTQAVMKYEDKYILNSNTITFLGLTIDNLLTWQSHIGKLTSKMNSATYILRILKLLLTMQNLRVVYFSYVHSIISYDLIFWGSSSHSKIIFKLQKRIIRILTNSNCRSSCQDLFKTLNILPLQSQYILSLAMFVVGNYNVFTINSDIHSSKYPPSPTLYKIN